MRIVALLLVSIVYFSATSAQTSTGSDRVRAAKVKFFTEKLELTQKESEKFWPIYNDYQSRRNKLATERKTIMQFFNENNKNMSADEISETLDRYIQIDKEQALLLETYNDKFKQVLSDEKVLKIYVTEIQFKNYLLKKLRTSQQNTKPRN
jgi:hypothetical protein